MRDYAERIEKKDALQAHPEYLNEQINDHDKAIYAKGWNDCNKEYYNAITELPVASIDCTDLSARLRRTFEADELVNQRILLDAADAIEELVAAVPKWISVEDDLPKANDRVIACVNTLGEPSVWDAVRWNGEEWEVEEEAVYEYWTSIDHPVTHWMPLPATPKESP